MLENIQEIINELHRMKKEYNAPQGCCVRTQERNGYRSKCLSIAIKALSEVQTLAKAKAEGRLVGCGIWERMINPFGELEGFMCECGHQSLAATNYCSNCGRKMHGGEAAEKALGGGEG